MLRAYICRVEIVRSVVILSSYRIMLLVIQPMSQGDPIRCGEGRLR